LGVTGRRKRLAGRDAGGVQGVVRQFCKEALRFLRQEKKWWLIPLLVFFLILAALVLFTQSPAPLSPFMYSVK
jgi:hypothetical protein